MTQSKIDELLREAESSPKLGAIGIRLMEKRRAMFASMKEAKLTGLMLDPDGRQFAENWVEQEVEYAFGKKLPKQASEVIIGSGYHAAVYAASRVARGFPKPIVLERDSSIGGAFGMGRGPTFYLNSRNRRGGPGLSGDRSANLNYLPGAPIQLPNMGMAEYPTNADMALLIRLTLIENADIYTEAEVKKVAATGGGTALNIELDDGSRLTANRIIDARGLGDPRDALLSNGSSVLTYPQFIERMSKNFPLEGLRSVAVIGGGNSGLTAAEMLLGLGPQPPMAAAALDSVSRVDLFGEELPIDCENWYDDVRSRYAGLGPYLRPDRFGVKPLNVINRRVLPIAIPGGVIVDGSGYDMAVICTGFEERGVPGLSTAGVASVLDASDNPVATKIIDREVYRVGPLADLPFTDYENDAAIDDVEENRVSMFRLGSKTASLAMMLSDPKVAEKPAAKPAANNQARGKASTATKETFNFVPPGESTELKVGDRVKVTQDRASSAVVETGDLGTVERTNVNSKGTVFVRMDNGKAWYFAPRTDLVKVAA